MRVFVAGAAGAIGRQPFPRFWRTGFAEAVGA